jgi:hypothetical protein
MTYACEWFIAGSPLDTKSFYTFIPGAREWADGTSKEPGAEPMFEQTARVVMIRRTKSLASGERRPESLT